MRKRRKGGRKLCICFIDYSKAFDMVSQNRLMFMLLGFSKPHCRITPTPLRRTMGSCQYWLWTIGLFQNKERCTKMICTFSSPSQGLHRDNHAQNFEGL